MPFTVITLVVTHTNLVTTQGEVFRPKGNTWYVYWRPFQLSPRRCWCELWTLMWWNPSWKSMVKSQSPSQSRGAAPAGR